MKIRQRGNPEEMKKIAEEAKLASISRGIAQPEDKSKVGGAYASMQNRIQTAPAPKVNIPEDIKRAFTSGPVSVQEVKQPFIQESNPPVKPGMLYSRIYESVETVGQTKEYFNATSSLFTLYALGQLNESVLRTLGREDLQEIRGIVREFQGILETY